MWYIFINWRGIFFSRRYYKNFYFTLDLDSWLTNSATETQSNWKYRILILCDFPIFYNKTFQNITEKNERVFANTSNIFIFRFKFVGCNPTTNKSAFVREIARCLTGQKSLLEQMINKVSYIYVHVYHRATIKLINIAFGKWFVLQCYIVYMAPCASISTVIVTFVEYCFNKYRFTNRFPVIHLYLKLRNLLTHIAGFQIYVYWYESQYNFRGNNNNCDDNDNTVSRHDG